jgi:hypothetical protein
MLTSDLPYTYTYHIKNIENRPFMDGFAYVVIFVVILVGMVA